MMTFLYSFRYATGQHELMSRQRAAYLQYIIETLIASSCLFPSAYTNFLDTLSILYITETYCFHIIAAAPGPWYRDRNWFDMPPAMQAQYTMAAMLTPPLYRNVPNNHFSASGRFLGSGRSSVAGLWLRQDAAHRVVQRIVTKKKKLAPFWLDHPQLHYVFHHVNNIPREIYCLKISRGRNYPRNVIALNYSKKLRSQGEIREYREYAPFGTLDDLIRRHKRIKYYNRSGKRTRVENEPLQEAFLWCVFEGLANAVHGMANVRIPSRWGRPVVDPFALPGGQGGTEIIHNKIKLSKVLLGSPDPNIFPHYPQVKVTGFDLAYFTRPDDATGRGNINPWLSLTEDHTPGFAPPVICHDHL
ncbi:hypothetical protein BDV97DRAFT_39122 [Delphinella strobiligena]|nr:hypothetical protein BDV97DRAFT_39122 [Delphinella strobiligena]